MTTAAEYELLAILPRVRAACEAVGPLMRIPPPATPRSIAVSLPAVIAPASGPMARSATDLSLLFGIMAAANPAPTQAIGVEPNGSRVDDVRAGRPTGRLTAVSDDEAADTFRFVEARKPTVALRASTNAGEGSPTR